MLVRAAIIGPHSSFGDVLPSPSLGLVLKQTFTSNQDLKFKDHDKDFSSVSDETRMRLSVTRARTFTSDEQRNANKSTASQMYSTVKQQSWKNLEGNFIS